MDGQLSLFSTEENSQSQFTVLEGKGLDNGEQLKCYKHELKSIEYKTVEGLFSGFNSIKAITFSYELSFIDSIMEHFDYGEVLLGADFIVQNDKKLNNYMAEVFTNSYEALQQIKPKKKLANMLKEGTVEFRTPCFVMDHRKIYLLKSDDGRTRVITSSANMSNGAWNGDHMEHYEYDDSLYCYEEYEKDFETVWNDSQEIPYSVVSSKKADDYIEGNVIIKEVKETGQAIVLQEPKDIISYERVKYSIDHEKIKEEYKALVSDVNMKADAKTGLFQLLPDSIKKIEHSVKKLKQRKYGIHEIERPYPQMKIDYEDSIVTLEDIPMNLSPSDEEVRNDIDNFITIFNNFDVFVGDTARLKENHFKLINAIFTSPFNAKLRCTAMIKNVTNTSLPLLLLIASETANCGKTFIVNTALKMMTGLELPAYNKANCKKEDVTRIQATGKCVPVFIDELDNKYLANIKDIIKHPEECEESQREEQPMIIFASNDVTEPDETLRKRMVFLRFDGALPSDIDQSAYKGKGNALIRRMGTGLYRKYLSRMVKEVGSILDYITISDDIPDEYYPDLMKISSEILISIFREYGYEIPSYMKPLTWNNDYSINADFISRDALDEIFSLYSRKREIFKIAKDTITIEMGLDKNSERKCVSWKNTLPAELKTEYIKTRDCNRIVLDRSELEKRLKMKFGVFHLFRKG